MVLSKKKLIAGLLAVTISGSAFGQEGAPAVPAPPTLWSFLGIPQGVKKVQGALTNRRGNLPKTEPKEALKALADPANLESPDLAIKRAAEIKKAEDLKPQKIKAIKYLTSIGCGCYDKDGSVTKALMAAAEDCTEDVRLSTMQQIHEAAEGKCCSNCGQVCCCNEDMLKKLAQIAYERDEYGCYLEPSKRVREAAAEALAACCPGAVPLEVLASEPNKEPETVAPPEREAAPEAEPEPESESEPTAQAAPTDEPERLPASEAIENEPAAPSPSDNVAMKFSDRLRLRQTYPAAQVRSVEARFAEAQSAHQPQANSAQSRARPTRLEPTWSAPAADSTSGQQAMRLASQAVQLHPARAAAQVPPGIARMRQLLASNPPQLTASPNPNGGVVLTFDLETTTAYVHFEQADAIVPVGTTLHLRPDPQTASGFNGTWQVIESAQGCANLVPVDAEGIDRIRVGDHVNFGAPDVVIAPISLVR